VQRGTYWAKRVNILSLSFLTDVSQDWGGGNFVLHSRGFAEEKLASDWHGEQFAGRKCLCGVVDMTA